MLSRAPAPFHHSLAFHQQCGAKHDVITLKKQVRSNARGDRRASSPMKERWGYRRSASLPMNRKHGPKAAVSLHENECQAVANSLRVVEGPALRGRARCTTCIGRVFTRLLGTNVASKQKACPGTEAFPRRKFG